MEWLLPAVITALLAFAPLGWQSYSEHRRKPLVQVHYWWQTSLEPRWLWLTPQVKVGLSRAVASGRGWWVRESRVLHDLDRIREGRVTQEEAIELRVLPAFRLATRRARADGVWALRVVVKNTSRRSVATPDEFGEVSLTVSAPVEHVHGWRKSLLGTWPTPAFADYHAEDPEEARLPLRLPHALAPGKAFRDELAVTSAGRTSSSMTPPVNAEMTPPQVRIRVKPWEPSTDRPFWVIPQRIIRWLRESYVPPIYVDTD